MSDSPVTGWYKDPQDSEKMRYWDGEKWTENTQPLPISEFNSAAGQQTASPLSNEVADLDDSAPIHKPIAPISQAPEPASQHEQSVTKEAPSPPDLQSSENPNNKPERFWEGMPKHMRTTCIVLLVIISLFAADRIVAHFLFNDPPPTVTEIDKVNNYLNAASTVRFTIEDLNREAPDCRTASCWTALSQEVITALEKFEAEFRKLPLPDECQEEAETVTSSIQGMQDALRGMNTAVITKDITALRQSSISLKSHQQALLQIVPQIKACEEG